ncbi:hypothetical protein HaLaN_29623 [Haematococcus lacustris]|uniref:Uncharacterized protein n=1 Tax=Haematococcus lacustris TaxID=44745 RepID=A0A6A0ADS7_HAELA|nr:hypothetical protein HaLaN_29623 [Haematococcus lacustris]
MACARRSIVISQSNPRSIWWLHMQEAWQGTRHLRPSYKSSCWCRPRPAPPPAAPPWQQQAAGAGAAPDPLTPRAGPPWTQLAAAEEQQEATAEMNTSSPRKRRAGVRTWTRTAQQGRHSCLGGPNGQLQCAAGIFGSQSGTGACAGLGAADEVGSLLMAVAHLRQQAQLHIQPCHC